DRDALVDVIGNARERIAKAADEMLAAQADASEARQLLTWLRRLGSEGQQWSEGQIGLGVSLVSLNHGDPSAPIELARIAAVVDATLAEVEAQERRNV